MKRIVSLLAVVSVLSSVAYAGEEPRSEVCIGIPSMPKVSEERNLDTWDFANNALLPTSSTTRSLYLVAFGSPVDPSRMYVYGIDVAAGQFLFAGSLSKRYLEQLSIRAAIDIGRFQVSGAAQPKGGGLLEIEGPTPPPPPPNITDWSVGNYGHFAWQKANVMHGAAW